MLYHKKIITFVAQERKAANVGSLNNKKTNINEGARCTRPPMNDK